MGRKFTIFALFYFVFEGKFQVQAPRGAYIWRGDLTEGFLRYRFGGLIFGRAYTWRGLFSEFYGIFKPREAAYQSVFLCDKQHESRRVRMNKPKFYKNPQVWC